MTSVSICAASFLLLASVYAVVATPLLKLNHCQDPERKLLEDMWTIHGSWHDSIFQLHNMNHIGTTLKNVSSDYVDIKHHALQFAGCPYGGGSIEELKKYHKDTQGRVSLCPHHDIINYDENRVPSTLFEKRCSCNECAFANTANMKTLGCKPVHYYVKVLRRVNCVDNEFIYRPVLEPLVVSCSCDHISRHSHSKGSGFFLGSPHQK